MFISMLGTGRLMASPYYKIPEGLAEMPLALLPWSFYILQDEARPKQQELRSTTTWEEEKKDGEVCQAWKFDHQTQLHFVPKKAFTEFCERIQLEYVGKLDSEVLTDAEQKFIGEIPLKYLPWMLWHGWSDYEPGELGGPNNIFEWDNTEEMRLVYKDGTQSDFVIPFSLLERWMKRVGIGWTLVDKHGQPSKPKSRSVPVIPPPIQPVAKEMPVARDPLSALSVLESDAHDAAWRTGAKQLLKLTKAPLVALLQRHLGKDDESLRAKLAEFLDTEIGEVLIASLLSVGISMMPGTSKATTERLAKELRVRAMSEAGDMAVDLLAEPMRLALGNILRDVQLPEVIAPRGLGEPSGATVEDEPVMASVSSIRK